MCLQRQRLPFLPPSRLKTTISKQPRKAGSPDSRPAEVRTLGLRTEERDCVPWFKTEVKSETAVLKRKGLPVEDEEGEEAFVPANWIWRLYNGAWVSKTEF
jgi:hypothetical protein